MTWIEVPTSAHSALDCAAALAPVAEGTLAQRFPRSGWCRAVSTGWRFSKVSVCPR